MVATNTLAHARDDASRSGLGCIRRALHCAAIRAWTKLVSAFKQRRPAWYELNDRMLRDIGKTAADAEFEALLHSWSGETRRSISQSVRSVLPQQIEFP